MLAAAGATTAVLWVVKFLAFDRLLFARAPGGALADLGGRRLRVRAGQP